MSASFVAVAFAAAVLLVNWRLVLLFAMAGLLALMAFGLGVVQEVPIAGSLPSGGVPTTAQVHPGPSGAEVGPPRTGVG